MNIISIDPGVTSGVVIASFINRVDTVQIRIRTACQDTSSAMIISRLRAARCRIVLMEQKPRNPSQEGLDTWENIYHRLMTLNFSVSPDMKIDLHPRATIFFASPSQWKPFMKSRAKIVPIKQHHVADAARMLHYFLQTNYPTKEIYYG